LVSKLENAASVTHIDPSNKTIQREKRRRLTRTTLLPRPSALRSIPYRLYSRSIPARRLVKPRRRVGTAVDAVVEAIPVGFLAELKAVSIHSLEVIAAARDVKGAGMGGDGAGGPVHAGGGIDFGGVEAVAVGVVACERHGGMMVGWSI
jgi:hypothetical protein